MRKFLYVIIFFTIVCAVSAQSVTKISTLDGRQFTGHIVSSNDYVITLQIIENVETFQKKYGSDTISIDTRDIESLYIDGREYVKYDGRFVSKSVAIAKQKEKEKIKEQQLFKRMASDPNLAIGNALKTTGLITLWTGVPCLVAGVSCLTAGHTMKINNVSDVQIISDLLESSYILMPVGSSLTIVGIPLYIYGKKIMEMNVNYNGNSVGLTMNF